jgi:FdhD protein
VTDGRKASTTRVRATVVSPEGTRRKTEVLATEEPLEIRVEDAATSESIFNQVTMRTPGADFELTAGLLLAEGIVQRADQLRQMEFCVGPKGTAVQQYNIVSAVVSGADPQRRAGAHFRTAVSACGVCGKASLDDLSMRGVEPLPDGGAVDRSVISRLPDLLRGRQALFEKTGGLHGAALITAEGDVLAVREDVGRHNAVDKVIGWALLNPQLAQGAAILMVSGRQSFELAQKAVVGRIPILAGVSAPSSLAVEVADTFNLTLIGFVRGERFTIYANPGRVSGI